MTVGEIAACGGGDEGTDQKVKKREGKKEKIASKTG